MPSTKINTRIQNKHDIEVNWKKAGNNEERPFIPLAGEIIVYDKELDSEGNVLELPIGRDLAYDYPRYKIGDGFTNVNDLPFSNAPGLEDGSGFNSVQQTNAQAISEGAAAFGIDTFAGVKGFTIISYSSIEKSYTLSSELPEDISTGVTYSAQIKNNFYNYGKVAAISNDRLTIYVDNYIDVDEMQAAAGAGVEIVKNIWFVDYPTAGDIDIGKYAFATGSGSKATQEYTFAAGRDNKSIGKYSSTLGRDNQAYYAAFAAGQNNKSLNERAYTLGNKNTVTGLNSGALGYNNTTSGDNAVALGNSLKATGNDQTVVGKANTEDADAMFIVGTGTYNNKAKNNAFVVKKDNTVEANFIPTKDVHLTNKKYVDGAISDVKTEMQNGVNEQIGTINDTIQNIVSDVQDINSLTIENTQSISELDIELDLVRRNLTETEMSTMIDLRTKDAVSPVYLSKLEGRTKIGTNKANPAELIPYIKTNGQAVSAIEIADNVITITHFNRNVASNVMAFGQWLNVTPNTDYRLSLDRGNSSIGTVYFYTDRLLGTSAGSAKNFGNNNYVTFNSGEHSRILVGFYSLKDFNYTQFDANGNPMESVSNLMIAEGTGEKAFESFSCVPSEVYGLYSAYENIDYEPDWSDFPESIHDLPGFGHTGNIVDFIKKTYTYCTIDGFTFFETPQILDISDKVSELIPVKYHNSYITTKPDYVLFSLLYSAFVVDQKYAKEMLKTAKQYTDDKTLGYYSYDSGYDNDTMTRTAEVTIVSGGVGGELRLSYDQEGSYRGDSANLKAGSTEFVLHDNYADGNTQHEAALSVYGAELSLKGTYICDTPSGEPEETRTFSISGVDNATINGKEILTEVNLPIKDGEAPYSLEQNSNESINNQAISEGAAAFGENTIAGLKGFNIVAWDIASNSYTLSSVLPEEIAINTVFSAQIKNNFYNHGKITSISNDRLTISVDNYINIVDMGAEGADGVRKIWFVSYPTVGDIDIGIYAFAIGTNSMAIQEYALATGRDNKSIGKYSATLGRGNEAYYAAFAAGQNNKALNERAMALGTNNTVTGRHGVALGYGNTVSGEAASALGSGLIASSTHQVVVGRNNEEDPDALFIAATGGLNDKLRENALVVKKSGAVEAGFKPTADNHLTNKKYVDEKIASIPQTDLSNYYTKSQADNKFLIDADLNNYYTKEEVNEKTTSVYITDADEAYSKQVPVNAQGIAKISSISGKSQVCRNLLKYPYYDKTKTANGITYTDNGDGTITLNGTAGSGGGSFYISAWSDCSLKAGTYTLSGVPGVAGWSTCTIVINVRNAAGTTIVSSGAISGSNNAKYTFTINEKATKWQIYIRLKEGVKFDNYVVAPMLNVGEEALPFESWFDGGKLACVNSIVSKDMDGNVAHTTIIPAEIQSLEGYSKDGFSMNLIDQTYTFNDITNILPVKFGPFFDVVPGGSIEFVNEDQIDVPNSITYVLDKEHAALWQDTERLTDSIANIDIPDIDLSDYVTKEYINDKTNGYMVKTDEDGYITDISIHAQENIGEVSIKGDLVDIYSTSGVSIEAGGAGVNFIADIAKINNKEIATQEYVDNAIANISTSEVPEIDLTNYYTKEEVDTLIDEHTHSIPTEKTFSTNVTFTPGKTSQEIILYNESGLDIQATAVVQTAWGETENYQYGTYSDTLNTQVFNSYDQGIIDIPLSNLGITTEDTVDALEFITVNSYGQEFTASLIDYNGSCYDLGGCNYIYKNTIYYPKNSSDEQKIRFTVDSFWQNDVGYSVNFYVKIHYSMPEYTTDYYADAEKYVAININQNKAVVTLDENSVIRDWESYQYLTATIKYTLKINVDIDLIESGYTACDKIATSHLKPIYGTSIDPGEDNKYTLGSANYRWKQLYAKTSTIATSDRNEKCEIEALPEKYSTLFDNLKPVKYKFIENESNRTHTGLISQDVEEALESAGLTSQDFAGFCSWDKEDCSKGYGLRYEEFIALCINEIQKIKQENKELKSRLADIETKLQ